MERKVGTISRGVRCPIIRENDNLADIVVESVLDAAKSEGFELRDRDVISVTESIVARAQGNYASIDTIAENGNSTFFNNIFYLYQCKNNEYRQIYDKILKIQTDYTNQIHKVYANS